MTSKMIINSTASVVSDALDGMLLSNSKLKRIGNYNILVREDIESYKLNHVTVISGGGSGHEPAHAGFIGHGMLSSAVLGNVFASPSVNMILAAIRICAGPKGVILVVKNYTGDKLNFGVAVEKAKQEGINAAMIIVDDDSALPVGKGITGGRGLAGTILVHKIVGYLSSQAYELSYICNYMKIYVVPYIRTLGVALSTCTVPGTPASTRLNTPNTYEVGLGIHGEPGKEMKTLSDTQSAEIIAKILVDGIIIHDNNNNTTATTTTTTTTNSTVDISAQSESTTTDNNNNTVSSKTQYLSVTKEDNLVLIVNNLGGLPIIQMYILAKEILSYMKQLQYRPIRIYIGHFMTSLEMAGVSLSVLKLVDSEKDNLLTYLDSITNAPAWIPSANIDLYTTNTIRNQTIPYDESTYLTESITKFYINESLLCKYDDTTLLLILTICLKIIEIEPLLTQYDNICGDGDCGIVMKAGSSKVLNDLFGCAISEIEHYINKSYENLKPLLLHNFIHTPRTGSFLSTCTTQSAHAICDQIATSISNSMGGTSGILLEIFFRAISSSLLTASSVSHIDNINSSNSSSNSDCNSNSGSGGCIRELWVKSIQRGVDAIQYYGGATIGMRTMLDALIPGIQSLLSGGSIQDAAIAAKQGAESTKTMSSLAGRSNYINQELLQGTPDPGAIAVATAFEIASKVLQS